MADPVLAALVAEFRGKDKQDVMLEVLRLRDEVARMTKPGSDCIACSVGNPVPTSTKPGEQS